MEKGNMRKRNQSMYALAGLGVVALGLGLRFWHVLPPLPGKYTGDALYALMAFCLAGVLAPRGSTAVVAGLALGWCMAVEVSQLVHTPWLDAVRATTLGHLVLGAHFGWLDLLAFLPGIALGVGVERLTGCRG
jgi:Protein of unknown function (DUF2809)